MRHGKTAPQEAADCVHAVANRQLYSIRTEGAKVNWIEGYNLFHE